MDSDDIALNGKDDTPKLLNVTWTWNGTARVEAPHDFGFVSFDITGISGATAGPGSPSVSRPATWARRAP